MREHKAVRIELIQGKGGIAAQAAHATLFLFAAPLYISKSFEIAGQPEGRIFSFPFTRP